MMVYSIIPVTGGVHIPMAFTCPYFWDKVLLLDLGETCPRFVFFIDIEGILGKIVEIYESSDFVSFLADCTVNLLNLNDKQLFNGSLLHLKMGL